MLRIFRLALVLLCAAPAGASAQLYAGLSGEVATGYLFRGLTFTNRLVFQPALTLGLQTGGADLSLEFWSNLEPAAYDAVDETSALDGTPGVTEWNVALAAAGAWRGLDVSGGIVSYVYPASGSGEKEPATVELVASAAWPATLSPGITAYYDLRAVRGLYVEGTLDWSSARLAGIELQALVGFSLGESNPDDRTAYFTRDGLTHAELGVSLPVTLGPLLLEPGARVVAAIDPATRLSSPERERPAKFLAGLALSCGGPRED
ncbi:MAG: hypothetical protein FIB01_08010 [Gemmatimonadetes bacterium]|nr:hypothetical protein [Gemmatimonadota bacterium]